MSKSKKLPNLPDKTISKKGSEVKQRNDISSSREFRRRYSILIAAIVVILMVVVFSIGMAFSWFAPEQDADLTVITTDFETQTLYKLSSSESDFTDLTDDVVFNIYDLDELQLKVKFTGPSSAYIRVQLFENFYTLSGDTEVMHPATDVTYTLGDDWIKVGDYYYYKNVVTYTEVNEKDENGKTVKKRNPTEVPFVTSASTKYDSDTTSGINMKLVAVVESVQPDRFKEFFGADPEWLFANN
ncbi:MAG: hypothetical protein IKT46_00145 [Clostridia bacterium]|nr:hypothetical protein [Clostridia bacterium]